MGQDPTPAFTRGRLAQIEEIPFEEAPSPSFIVHTGRLEENCRILRDVAEATEARILLALKGFACHSCFPILRPFLDGTTSSGLHEALLADEFFQKEVHVYSPAFKPGELEKLRTIAHSIVFNSPAQLLRGLDELGGDSRPEIGLRVNPEYSEVETDLYDPAAPDCRLGTTAGTLAAIDERARERLLANLDGLHFHALCEQDADALEHTLAAFEERFAQFIPSLKWVNLGGGHHITRPGYDIERLCRVVRDFRERYEVEVYLEPGEAVALHTGVLVTTVLDVVEAGGVRTAIVDTSATCHMPDVLEMPYRPAILGADDPGKLRHDYRIGGLSCLAGDVVGDYSFPHPLQAGDRVVFLDMAHYTMVKTTTFNGVPLPSICTFHPGQGLKLLRSFGYEDYRDRLS